MKRNRSPGRMGNVLFFIPAIAILVLVLFGLISSVSSQSGTLIVSAMSSGRYSPSVQLHVSVTVGASTGTTPFNLTLTQGGYTVVYGQKNWYVTPPPRSILLSGGKTEYAVATYSPVIRAVAVTQNGFNSTSITAMHGVTPVVWINEGDSVEVLQIDTIGRLLLNPSQNYTLVFSSPGTFNFYIYNTGISGSVSSL